MFVENVTEQVFNMDSVTVRTGQIMSVVNVHHQTHLHMVKVSVTVMVIDQIV